MEGDRVNHKMRDYLKNVLGHMFERVLGLLGITLIVFLFAIFYEGSPFSLHLIGLLFIFLFATKGITLFQNRPVSHSGSRFPAFLSDWVSAFLRSIRVACIPIFPLLALQIYLKTTSFLMNEEAALKVETWLISLDRFFDSIDIKQYLLLAVVVVGVLSVFSNFLRKRAKNTISRLFSVYAGFQVVIFLTSFSFFTMYVADTTEETWRLEKRTELQDEEDRLQRMVNENIILQNILISERIQVKVDPSVKTAFIRV